MKYIPLFLLLILLAACKSNRSPEQRAVESAWKSYQKTPSDSAALNYTKAVDAFVAVKGYADSTSAKYVLQAGRVSAERNNWPAAFNYQVTYIARYQDRPNLPELVQELISTTEKLNQPELNQVVYKSFVDRFPQHPTANELNARIDQKEVSVDSTLKFIGQNMFNDSNFRLNEERSRLYIQACKAATAIQPGLVNAPEFLYRSAETARTLRDIPTAIQLYDWIIDAYPTHPRAAVSLFLKAFTYDNDLKDFTKAGQYYNEFLTKYSDNEFAESAKFLLDNLGKSEEDLRKMLEEKSKENVQ